MNESSNRKANDQSQQNKQRLIHESQALVDVGLIYDFVAYDSFGTTSINVLRVLRALVQRMPVVGKKKDIAASVWLARSGIREITGMSFNRITESFNWLKERGFLDEKIVGKTRYRAFTTKGIEAVHAYAVKLMGPDVGPLWVRKPELTGPDVGPNRERDREKNIDSRGGDAERSAKTTVVESTTAKKSTTTNLFRFYGDINKVTGPADAREKNEPFKEALARHGPEGFAYALGELQRDRMVFVWDKPVESNELHYSCILDVFDDLLRNAKPG
jgi:hypothetical protein